MATMSRATRRIVVMHLMRIGMTVPQIASELGVSPDTVRRDAAAGQQDAPQDAEDAHHLMRPDARPVAPQVGRYERETHSIRALLAEPLSVEQMDALEASDSDAPSKEVAARLEALAAWQDALQRLADTTADRAFLAAEQQAYERCRAETNAAFVGWWFDGWARTPQDGQDAATVSGLVVPWTPPMRRELSALCAAYNARPEHVARFAIHQAARHVQRWQDAREHNEGRRTA